MDIQPGRILLHCRERRRISRPCPARTGLDQCGALRADNFTDFMVERKKRLLKLIETATGHTILEEGIPPEEGEELTADMARDSELDEQAA